MSFNQKMVSLLTVFAFGITAAVAFVFFEPPYEWKCRAEENRFLIASCVALGHKNAKFVELDYCDHGRALAAGLPYLEFFIKGRLSGF